MYDWQNSYSVGVKAFDDAHQQLFVFFDEFYAAMREGKSQDKIGAILAKTQTYTRQHFESEERWLAAKHDPNLEMHKAEHRRFEAQIEALIAEFKAGKIGLSGTVSKTLREWLSGHIMQVDQQYAKRHGAGSSAS